MSAQETRWKRDGWEASVRIGVLTPHADVGPESELQAMAPPGVAIHATRVPFGAMASDVLPGIGRDAEYIAKHIASREPNGRPRAHAMAGARRPEAPDHAWTSGGDAQSI